VVQLSHGCGDAAPQVLAPLLAAAQAVAQLRGLQPPAASAVSKLVSEAQSAMQAVVAARVPLVQSHRCVCLGLLLLPLPLLLLRPAWVALQC
jgi:hypothetical protein